jgi:quercetin dioxygenase-like cupin family protein
MLTYFDVQPHTRFESHSHSGEQITYVLEGELMILFEKEEVVMQAGDVVAIPAGVKHAVLTKSLGCKALDAWSPPEPRYRRMIPSDLSLIRLP